MVKIYLVNMHIWKVFICVRVNIVGKGEPLGVVNQPGLNEILEGRICILF